MNRERLKGRIMRNARSRGKAYLKQGDGKIERTFPRVSLSS